MTVPEIELAKRESHHARARLDSTLAALQVRLAPKTLATEAWDGVRERSNEMAESALDAVKERPGMASAAVGAAVLFLARRPLFGLARKLFTRKPADDGVVTTVIPPESANYSPAAPLVEVPPIEGVLK